MDDVVTVVTAYSAEGGEIRLTLRYTYSDPWAIKAIFRSERTVTWWLSRDLLVAGLASPDWVGDCDVQFRRRSCNVTECGDSREEVELHLSSPSGTRTLTIKANPISQFLCRTWRAVPIGDEQHAIGPVPNNPAELINASLRRNSTDSL